METRPMHAKPRRGIATVADIKARCVVDAATGCWHWQAAKSPAGLPMLHAFDHALGEKRVMCGPLAVWNIAHGESPAPWLVFRSCEVKDCMNPVHMTRALTRGEIGLHARRSGSQKGTHLEVRRRNGLRGLAKLGIKPLDEALVIAILREPATLNNCQVAALHGVKHQTVSRIRRRERHRQMEAV